MKTKNYWFRLIFISFFGLLLVNSSLSSLVNWEEFLDLEPIEFINYEGPNSRIDTRAQIREIGYSLGLLIKDGQSRAGGIGRYFVVNSETGGSGLDADIFGLGVDVGVVHIRNLRLILQGYLEGAYSYSEREAAVLAEYITIYNAVYRGDINFFDSRYNDPVMEHLNQERLGLSIRFDEWPGQTLMVIPLGSIRPGPLSSIDTSSLINNMVTELLREEPDMGLDTRIEMAELLDRQAEEAIRQAAVQWEAIIEGEKLSQGFSIEQLQDLDILRKQTLEIEEFAVRKINEAQEERRRITEDLLSLMG